MNDIIPSITKALTGTFVKIGEFIPTLFSALIILLIGWLIARSLRWAFHKLLQTVKFNDLADKVGVNGFLAKGGLKTNATGLIAKLVYWIIMFVTLGLFFDNLGLEVVSNLLTDVVAYIPNIIVACLLLIVGMYLAEFVSGLVVAALKGGDFTNPELVGRIAYGVVMFFTIAIIMNQLNIAQDLVNNVVTIILGGLGIAVGIAFGLGGKDWAGGVINKYMKG